MAKTWKQIWLAGVILAVSLPAAAILGLWGYMAATATPIHPNPDQVLSVARSSPPPKWTAAVEAARKIVREDISRQNLPGLSVAVGLDGEMLWAEGFGFADLDTRQPVDPEMRFRTGGVAMALTSVAVGQLIDRHVLNLDEEIQAYVPAYPRKRWRTTLRQVMGHVAGMPNDGGDEEDIATPCARTLDGLSRFSQRDLLFEPGTEYRYRTYGWILVSAAVESAAGEPFYQFMRSRVFEPLGMTRTIPDRSSDAQADHATFYFPRFAADTRYGPESAREGGYSCFAGGGGFLSTPSDLVRFGMATAGGSLLQAGTLKELQTSQRLRSGEETGYGLGWDIDAATLAGQPMHSIGHDSEFMIGSTTTLLTFPERGLVVAVATNITFADVHALAVRIAEAFATSR